MDNGEFEATFFTTVLVVDFPLERHLLVQEAKNMCAHKIEKTLITVSRLVEDGRGKLYPLGPEYVGSTCIE
jgi:hypothetical protein